jgi:hypothetical protein
VDRKPECSAIASPAQALPQAREGIRDAFSKKSDAGTGRDEQRCQHL